jgi:hypothetical protein
MEIIDAREMVKLVSFPLETQGDMMFANVATGMVGVITR